ncbi:hypothetical protein J7F01_15420 [Streptomyces sp. ISL-22]|uniref:hypothetical protein n=1 Tax=unclassified Streptomyces TaxID=2593676 RepID=UPI001BE5EBBC|nr:MULTISPECIES: hypothetical protein [unclassified Streptomyces]MBT2419549.1 hypothetical protein [Streptomyces sp. ISL-24]MBT2433546.1 hypothetical protein [Streptomyces sp. ISL-22]
MGEEQVAVQAELGVFTPARDPEWGGLLRGVPPWLAVAMCQLDDVRLRLPGEEERRVHLVGKPVLDDQGRLVVFFRGEGPPPV